MKTLIHKFKLWLLRRQRRADLLKVRHAPKWFRTGDLLTYQIKKELGVYSLHG